MNLLIFSLLFIWFPIGKSRLAAGGDWSSAPGAVAPLVTLRCAGRERDHDPESDDAAAAATAATARPPQHKRERRLPSLRLANGRLGSSSAGASPGGAAAALPGAAASLSAPGAAGTPPGAGAAAAAAAVSEAQDVAAAAARDRDPAGTAGGCSVATSGSVAGSAADTLVTAGEDAALVSDYISPEMNYREQKVRIQSVTDDGSLYGTPREEVQQQLSPPPAEPPPAGHESKQGFIRNQLQNLFQPTDNKLAMKLFGSKKALMKERIRQKAAGHWIIHPCSNFRLVRREKCAQPLTGIYYDHAAEGHHEFGRKEGREKRQGS